MSGYRSPLQGMADAHEDRAGSWAEEWLSAFEPVARMLFEVTLGVAVMRWAEKLVADHECSENGCSDLERSRVSVGPGDAS